MEKLAEVEMSWGDRLRAEGEAHGEARGIETGKMQAQQQIFASGMNNTIRWLFFLALV